jgi:hypothetical protein
MLKYVYKIDNIEEAEKKDPEKYRKVMRPFFELSFLD